MSDVNPAFEYFWEREGYSGQFIHGGYEYNMLRQAFEAGANSKVSGAKKLSNGSKARQREDCEDRNIQFSNALRLYGVPATDVDYVVTDGRNKFRAVLEVTRPDEIVFSPKNYLKMIDERRRDLSTGNHNDNIIAEIAHTLGAISLLVVFEPNVCEPNAQVWVRNIRGTQWTHRNAVDFFPRLRAFAYANRCDIKSLEPPEPPPPDECQFL